MKTNIKLFIVLFICSIFLMGIVNADTSNSTLNASIINLVQGNSISTTSQGGGSGLTLYANIQNSQYLTGLTSMTGSNVEVFWSSWAQGIMTSWTAPANITYNGASISSGQIYFNFVSNSSPTVSYWQITYSPVYNANMSVGISGIEPFVFTEPSNWQTAGANFVPAASSATPTSAAYAYFWAHGSSYQAAGGGTGNAVGCSYLYNFKNYADVFYQNSLYPISVVRNVGGNAYYSVLYIADSLGTYVPGTGGNNNININAVAPPIFVSINDVYTGTWWNKSYFYPSLNLSAPITNSTVNTVLTFQLSSSSGVIPSDINAIVFNTNYYNSNAMSGILYDANTTVRHPLNFIKKSGVWYQDDGNGFNINVGANFPQSLSTIFLTANNYRVTSTVASSITGGFAVNNYLYFYITGTASNSFAYFTVNDQRTGSIISNSNIGIFDVPNQHWINYTLAAGTLFVPLQTNYYYSYQGSANNYVSSAFIPLFLTGNQTIPINLLPSTLNIVTGNTTLSVTAEDSGTYAPIAGATVTVSNTNQTSGYAYSQSLVTSTSGLALFTVPNNQIYTVNVQATGYQAGSSIVSVGTNAALSLIYLTPVSAIPTVTSIITVQTTVPLGIGNSTSASSGINGDGKCSTTMPSSFLGAIYNFLACEGITTQAGENIICAIGLLMILLYVGGRYGGGLGAVIGAASGYVLDLLIGWLPLWTLIAFIVIAALILSAKIFLSSE